MPGCFDKVGIPNEADDWETSRRRLGGAALVSIGRWSILGIAYGLVTCVSPECRAG